MAVPPILRERHQDAETPARTAWQYAALLSYLLVPFGGALPLSIHAAKSPDLRFRSWARWLLVLNVVEGVALTGIAVFLRFGLIAAGRSFQG